MSQQSIALPTGILTTADVWLSPDEKLADNDVLRMQRFLAGDDAAFEQLFNAHNHRLYCYCTNIVRDTQAAEDITQEMWLKVLRLRAEPKEITNPAGLFVTIVRNLSLNYLDRQRRRSAWEGLEESLAAPTHERSLEEEMVTLALERLSFDYREVLILNVYSGYTLEEIAVMLDKSREAIWKRSARARAKLSKLVVEMLTAERQTINGTAGGNEFRLGGRND